MDASSITAIPPDRCGACLVHVSPLSEVRAASLYRAPLDRLLPRFKFHRDLAAGRVLATTMAAAFAPLAERMRSAGAAAAAPTFTSALRAVDLAGATSAVATGRGGIRGPNRSARPAHSDAPTAILIPVPLHRSRLRQRGYDQALELARPLSRRLGLSVCASGLHRARDTPPQSRLDAAQRRRNLAEAFVWIADAPPPAHAILIDDVLTTGATLHAAALALRRAGAQRVDAWVCARTL
ncbi:ComF family protein [Lysobacter enzymogenes]|uniref:ComF family protein n=1 Tax=Lysobacter enzymogenes TaxID=69 RepID=UPI00384E5957